MMRPLKPQLRDHEHQLALAQSLQTWIGARLNYCDVRLNYVQAAREYDIDPDDLKILDACREQLKPDLNPFMEELVRGRW
jgi:hypothetical protein